MGGYFLLHGKKLFSEIFFNHAPGLAYVSFLIQYVSDPINLYELILRHRQFVLLAGFFGNLLLLLRFGHKVIVPILLYELSKFYLFGDRFLAEAIIVYPIVYLALLAWNTLKNEKLYIYDYCLTVLFVWFILFTREPYIPVTLVLLFVIMLGKGKRNTKIIALIFLFVLSITALFYHNVSDFIFNVYTINVSNILLENTHTKIFGTGIFQAFLYPFWVFFSGKMSLFRYILIFTSLFFTIKTIWFIYKKKYKKVIFVWGILGLANLRPVTPGSIFYESFHTIIWYALLLFFSFSFLFESKQKNKYWYSFLLLYFIPFLFLFIPKTSYLYDKLDTNTQFITNYGSPLQVGNVVAALSVESDSLFLDGFDDIIYWVAQRQSEYSYSWYTSLMPGFPIYTDARLTMFRRNPPDFYYGSCLEFGPQRTLPAFLKNEYVRLSNFEKPSCLWVHKAKLSSITDTQWDKAKQLLYTLPKNLY